jgi:uncharacterized protein
MAAYLFVTSYLALAVAGLIVELVFKALGLVPATRHAIVPQVQIALDYTKALNVISWRSETHC